MCSIETDSLNIESTTIRCARCHQYLPKEMFWRDKLKVSGRQGYCIPCKKSYQVAHYVPLTKRKDAERLSQKEYHAQYYKRLSPEKKMQYYLTKKAKQLASIHQGELE